MNFFTLNQAAYEAQIQAQMNQASQDYSNDYISYNETQLYSAMSDDERAKAVKKDEAYVSISFLKNLIFDEL